MTTLSLSAAVIVKQAVPSEADVIDTARYTAHGRRPLSTPSANTHTHTHTHATETGTVFTGTARQRGGQ